MEEKLASRCGKLRPVAAGFFNMAFVIGIGDELS